MKFKKAKMIFFLSIIALVVEFIFYITSDFELAFTGDFRPLSGPAFFLVSLMILTAATGVLAPICSLFEFIVNRKNIGIYTMLFILSLIVTVLVYKGKNIDLRKFIDKPELPKKEDNKDQFPPFWVNTKTRNLNVRTGPSTVSEIFSSLRKGEKVHPIDQDGEWYQIKLPDGKTGWICARHLSPFPIKPYNYNEKKDYFDNKIKINFEKDVVRINDEEGVWGEIKNTGEKTLTRLEIKIYGVDKNGIRILKGTIDPLKNTEGSSGDIGPLRPEDSRKFFVRVDDSPSDWAKEVRIGFSDLEFLDQ